MTRRPRGFTLLELTIAFAVLVTGIVGAWGAAFAAQRHQRLLWDELAAQELAVSALETAFADGDLKPTPPAGRPVTFPASGIAGTAPNLLEFQVLLHVALVPENNALYEIRAIVTWAHPLASPGLDPRRLERSLRRRVKR